MEVLFILSLNEEQRKFVEENHNLIYAYARKRKADIDEVYDILAMALCTAARTFDRSKNYQFSTYAYVCMGNRLNQYWRKESKRVPTVSYELLCSDCDGDSDDFVDNFMMADTTENTEDEVIASVQLSELFDSLSEKQKNVFNLRRQGYTYREIEEQLGYTRSCVMSSMHAIIRRVNKLLNN